MDDSTEPSTEKLARALEERTREVERLREQLAVANNELAIQITSKNEKFYENLLQNSPSLICTHDLNGVLLSVNATAIHLLGRSVNEIVGRNLADFLSPSVRHLFDEYLDRIRKASNASGMMRLKAGNGEERLVVYQNVLIAEKDQQPYVLGNAQDITNLFRTQRALRISEERYRLLFENNPYPMWVSDTETYAFLAVNEAAIRTYGFTREEFLKLTILDIRPAEDVPQFLEHMASLRDQSTVEEMRRHKKKDGTIFFVRVRAHPIPFEGRKARMVLASDVTAALAAEEMLRRSEERFQLAAKATNDVVWDWNVPDDVVWANEAFTTLFGHKSEEIEPGAAGWFSLLHPEDKERISNSFSTVIDQRQQFWSGEYRLRRKDGSYAFVLDRSFLILDDSGKPLRMIGCMTDISDRKLAEERLARQNEYFSVLHDTAINLMSRLDLNDVLEAIVSRMSELTKLPNAFLCLLDDATSEMSVCVGLGLSRDFIRHPALYGSGVVGKVWESGEPVIVEDYRNWPHRSKEPAFEMFHSVTGVPLKLGPRVIGVLGVQTVTQHSFSKDEIKVLMSFAHLASLAFDNARLYTAAQKELAERIQAEGALRKSEEKFRLLFEEAKDVFFISSIDGRFIDINPAGMALFGYSSKQEMLDLNIERDLFHDPARRQVYQNLMKEQGYVKDFELQLRRKDGVILTILETATAVHDSDGNVTAYRGIMRDVTQLKHLQQQLLQWQKIETIGQLAGGVAHDFNNLLMAISGHCEVLEMKMPQGSPMLNDLNEIKKAADAGASLTRRLLAFGRKQVLEPKVVNLNRVIEATEIMLRRLIGEHVILEFNLDPGLGIVKVDPNQFEQVILNLSTNARDAMPEGGKLSFQTANIIMKDPFHDTDSSHTNGDYVMITISDSGCGMDSETMSHIFEPFFTTKQEERGTGLGLPTVYGIVKQSDGHILVESQVGKGTIFRIYLPRVDLPHVHDHVSSQVVEREANQIKILLVDDNESILHAVGAFLDMKGFQVSSAHSPILALELSKKMGPIDVLITDVVMPNMTGPQLAEAIRNSNPQVKVLFLSGYSDEAVRKQGVLDQRASFLQKPASMQDLLKKINFLLR